MAMYVSKRCPNCKHQYATLESDMKKHWGTPFRTCFACGKEFVDHDYREVEIVKHSYYEAHKLAIYMTCIPILIFFISFVIDLIFKLDFQFGLLAFILFPSFLIGLRDLLFSINETDAVSDGEKRESKKRCRDINYLKKLEANGIKVPAKIYVLAEEEAKKKNKKLIIKIDDDAQTKETIETILKCGKCGENLLIDSKYCPTCGFKIEDKQLIKFCKFCGCELISNAKFCRMCGKEI